MIQYLDLLGAPFRYGGRGNDGSYDCYGLAIEIYKRAGLELPFYESSDSPEVQALRFAQGAEIYLEPVKTPEPLDFLMFQIIPKFVSHCGIYLGHGKFIHITSRTSVTVEQLALGWQDKLRGIYRLRRDHDNSN